jgi:hypothetical protein
MAPEVKTAKNSKLPKLSENCFEPVGKGGWPSISTWIIIVDGYTILEVPPTNDKVVKFSQNNSKATNALMNGLSEMIFTKVSHCKYAKEIWDKLQNIYEGDSKVKAAKLQT